IFIIFSLLSCMFVFAYAFLKIPKTALPFSLFATTFIAMVAVLSMKTKDETTVMISVLGILGVFYFFICPFEMPPDEPAHLLRAFEISTGRLFARPLSSGAFGDVLPSALKDCWNRSAVIDWNDNAEIGFSTSALYSFVSYIPQSIGILLARIFTSRLAVVYYMGRLFNFLAAFALSVFTLKKIPFGKKILFIFMVLPMTLQEMISLSPDAFVNSLSFAFIAFILDCAYAKPRVTKKDILIIGAMLSMISLCKVVYLVALFLVYIIPSHKLEKREIYWLKVFVPLLAVTLSLLSLAGSAYTLTNSQASYSSGANAREQAKFILTHPFSYMMIFVKTLLAQTPSWIGTCIGSALGWLDIKIDFIVYFPFLLMLLFQSIWRNDIPVQIQKNDILLFALTFFAGTVLILTSLYVQWTPLRAKMIDGVQGRYFIPLLPSLFFALAYARSGKISAEKGKLPYLPVAILALNFTVLATVYDFYQNAAL
ncbi:MAG: DUF2142 domain-containing protein, partial [Treponemataceae bacterium]|nr:DUF2142 domain-containing protein [Treponemataceae bacterium]